MQIQSQQFLKGSRDPDSALLGINCSSISRFYLPTAPNSAKLSQSNMWKPQWEKANVEWYQDAVTDLLAGIVLPMEIFHCDGVNSQCHDQLI